MGSTLALAAAFACYTSDDSIKSIAMLRTADLAVVFLACTAISPAWAGMDCSAAAVARQPLSLPSTVTAPLAAELQARNAQLGMPSGGLAGTYSFEQSAERVLQRLRIDGCQNVAAAVAVPTASAQVAAVDPAAYQPQTEHDNTPWRFDMTQGGKRMTAEEFDAWMQARGVRVVRPRGEAAPAAVEPVVK